MMDKVRKVETFKDDRGRVVNMLTPVSGGEPYFTGVARIRVVPYDITGPETVREKDYEFAFPETMKTLEDAFRTFDELVTRNVDENNARVKAKYKLADQGAQEDDGAKEAEE